MSNKAKPNELYKLCEQLFYDRVSFDDIQQWLDNNKYNDNLLKQAASYKNKYNNTPLSWLACGKSPSDLVERLLQLAPDTIKIQHIDGSLPLHAALYNSASSDVITTIFKAYPKAAEVQNDDGELPLHYALENNASSDVIKMLFQAYPEAAEVRNDEGESPFDIALNNNASDNVINMLFEGRTKLITTPSIKRKLDPYKPNRHGTVTAENSSMTSTAMSSIRASSNFAPQVIGDPKKLKQVMEPTIKRRNMVDLTVPDKFKGSHELDSLSSELNGNPCIVPEFKHEEEPTIEDAGETLKPGCRQDVHATLSEGFKKEKNSESLPLDEGKIFIENHTTYVLYVTIHGEKETRSVVGPKLEDECSRKSFTIQGNSVYVTIKNNAYPKLCCGWEERLLINKGCRHSVQGEPYLRFGNCRHV